ncbi:MAG: hypothetical protein JRH07_12480 [Deltaproteobacteria bacterium]|nr:hypothetical protein [Deltaproteobacteria bacterium]
MTRVEPMVQSGQLSQRERRLQRQGWKRQFVASEPRLSEAVELYREAGYEVHLEPLGRGVDPGGCNGCTVCFDGFEDRYRVIYTRHKKESPRLEDDLW